jgi:glycosyltransferase involved in cell wall biosynthesis
VPFDTFRLLGLLKMPHRLSFIVPAYNEEKHLEKCLRSIREFTPDHFATEILVVDNGSRDSTVRIAQGLGVPVISLPGVTVAKMRNCGVKATKGEFLVFLDADVCLTEAWKSNITQTIARLREDPDIVTGSKVGIPSNASFLERHWFAPLVTEGGNYVNSGHLITSRHLFEKVKGFTEHLATGEDYDFSMKARAARAKIENKPSLVVVHYGYPRTVAQFVRREVWHGLGDAYSWGTLVSSKVALIALVFTFLHVSLLLNLLLIRAAVLSYFLIAMIYLIALAASVAKYRGSGLRTVLINTVFFYLFFWARAIAIVAPANMERSR